MDLIEAELSKKKRSNRVKGKNYAFGRVLNDETITEREAYKQFKDHWTWISRCQPNLLIPKKKKTSSPVKTAAQKPILQLTPSVSRLLSPSKARTPSTLASPVRLAPRKASVPRKAVVPRKPKEQAKGRAIRPEIGPAVRAEEHGPA